MNKVIRKLRIIDLEKPALSQSRVGTNPETIATYQALWESGEADFPPIIVFHDGEKYHVADGFHRVQSLTKARLDKKVEHRTIACEVRSGTIEDAIAYSLGANLKHGLLPSTADKKRSILLYYGLSAEHCAHSNNAVAKVCGCSHTFVGAWKTTCITMPVSVTHVETKIPQQILEQTIANLKMAATEGKIVTTRNGKELTQKASPKPLQMPLQMPLQASVAPIEPKRKEYVVTRPQATKGVGTIHRGIIVSGFESLTDTGKVAITVPAGSANDYKDEVVLIPIEDLIMLPYPIGSSVSPIGDDFELVINSYALIADDLKIKSTDLLGFPHNHSSSELEPFVKKVLEPAKNIPAVPQNNIDAADKPATPILNLLNLTDSELNDLQVAIGSELRRRGLSQNVPDLTVS